MQTLKISLSHCKAVDCLVKVFLEFRGLRYGNHAFLLVRPTMPGSFGIVVSCLRYWPSLLSFIKILLDLCHSPLKNLGTEQNYGAVRRRQGERGPRGACATAFFSNGSLQNGQKSAAAWHNILASSSSSSLDNLRQFLWHERLCKFMIVLFMAVKINISWTF